MALGLASLGVTFPLLSLSATKFASCIELLDNERVVWSNWWKLPACRGTGNMHLSSPLPLTNFSLLPS